MALPKDLTKRIMAKYGRVIDLEKEPGLLDEIVQEVTAYTTLEEAVPGTRPPAPFEVDWMDSWISHWMVNERLTKASARERDFTATLRSLVDLRFHDRLLELREFLRENPRIVAPDGGPPEPGTPPAGPAFAPDGGPPEPGTPPAGPVFEPPDGGPPEPGTPEPPGPQSGYLGDNPWILYWFVSLRAPLIVDLIDTHFTRRMNDLRLAQR